ncbi:hypothetical protein [Bacillus manliponensis]|uniref:hypothetical protein n=1 Tax=Bacillus manliponensis TaxID=574376 RepID=UPI0035149254
MKKLFFLMTASLCIVASSCSSHEQSETKVESETKENEERETNIGVKPYKEPLSQVGEEAKHPLGTFMLKQLSEPNATITAGPLQIQIERIKIVQSTKEISEIGLYNLKERGLSTEQMNAIQFTAILENSSEQDIDLNNGSFKTLLLSNGEEVDVSKMSADPKKQTLKAKQKMPFTLICFLTQAPNDIKSVKIITDVVKDLQTRNELNSSTTTEITM